MQSDVSSLESTSFCRKRRKKDEASEFTFACPICFKMFKTGQALGGHQNAHRHERNQLFHPFISAAYAASRSPTLWNFHIRETPQPPQSSSSSSPIVFFPPSCCAGKPTLLGTGEESADGGVSVVSSERTESDSCCNETVSDMGEEMDLELRLGGR